MMASALTRRLKCGAPAWRALQRFVRVPSCQGKRHGFHTSSNTTPIASLFSRPVSARLLSSSTSRLCQVQTESPQKGERPDRLSMKALGQAPRPALYVGSTVLLPFVAAPLLMAATQSYYPEVAYAHVVYGAAIVSFLGGARWGYAIPEGSPAQPDWMNLGNSVLPSLLAWGALMCRDNVTEGAMIVMMGLGLTLHYDLVLLPAYPGWFRAMRTLLTLVAIFSLVATLTLEKFCPEKKITALRA